MLADVPLEVDQFCVDGGDGPRPRRVDQPEYDIEVNLTQRLAFRHRRWAGSLTAWSPVSWVSFVSLPCRLYSITKAVVRVI